MPSDTQRITPNRRELALCIDCSPVANIEWEDEQEGYCPECGREYVYDEHAEEVLPAETEVSIEEVRMRRLLKRQESVENARKRAREGSTPPGSGEPSD